MNKQQELGGFCPLVNFRKNLLKDFKSSFGTLILLLLFAQPKQ